MCTLTNGCKVNTQAQTHHRKSLCALSKSQALPALQREPLSFHRNIFLAFLCSFIPLGCTPQPYILVLPDSKLFKNGAMLYYC